jgi:hypothetical protein
MATANKFLFAVAEVFDGEDGLYDLVQKREIMKLKGKKFTTNKDIDCRPTGGPFIPIGSYGTIMLIRRLQNCFGKKIVWVEFDYYGQRNVFLEDLEIMEDVNVVINATGETKPAEIVEMNCVKVGNDYLQAHEYTLLPEDEGVSIHEEVKRAIQDVVADQGWNDNTLGAIATEFIGQAGLNKKFLEYIKEIAAEENEAANELKKSE